MKKRIIALSTVILLSGSILFTSCIGSFGLTGKVYSWNKSQAKWIDELLFLVLCIVPVYEVTLFVDAIVLNSIEFWTGSNPIAFQPGEKRNVETENGIYTVEAVGEGYKITKDGEEGAVDLVYDKGSNACYLEANGQKIRIK